MLSWLAAIVAIAGAWLAVSFAVYTDGSIAVRLSSAVSGVVLAAVGGYNYVRLATGMRTSLSTTLLGAILGAWLALSPFTLGVAGRVGTLLVIVGVLVASAAGYTVYRGREYRPIDRDLSYE